MWRDVLDSPLRILLISRCPAYPLHLGDRLIVYHLARELSGRGYRIDLLAFDDGAAVPDLAATQNFFATQQLFPDPKRGMVDYVRRLIVPAARFPNEAGDSWSPELWRAIRKKVTTEKYDLVHFFGGVQVYEYLRAVDPLPAIITPYESYSLYLRREVELGAGVATRIRHAAARAYESWMFNRYRRVVVLTERDREELREINPYLPVEVIPNGVDLAYFDSSEMVMERKTNTLLFTGNFAYPPNLDAAYFLIEEVLPHVQAQIPDAVLWLVGANPPAELMELADEDVIVTGQVADMRTYLATASVFACPLKVGAGIKNKVLEALAMGCPVIATPLSMDGISVQDGESALIANADANDFADEIVKALRDPALRERLSSNGQRVIAQGYNWAAVADRYETLYSEILN